ncbi:Subtilase family protein [Dethiosulfatibacter aminovorans DSM 17477]|uniref:Subtilase family protein n=1 Tax=Dethiosulfatibacter aminovorans DSM 17477 TaxID=1121476 RepID=A0A1M6IJM9_9FIRM|nr:S8 family peptidase [Dethiosulfatibacter aminovorans]SHJ34691.1 Subtilase family protein [Dethiosulfatibacter aminovorans DSM 17477]
MKRKSRAVIYVILAVILLLSTFVRAYGDYGTGNLSSDGQQEKIGITEYLNDQIIVKFKDDISDTDRKLIKKYYKLIDKAKFKSGGEVLKLKGNLTVEELVEMLGELDSVEYAGFDYIMRATDFPDDPWDGDSARYLWGMEKIDANGDTEYPGAWNLATGNPEVIVAVIDTGVDMGHVDLAENIWINEVELNGDAGVDDDGNGYIDDVHGWDFHNGDGDPTDDQGHGTHCSGTIAAAANGIGVAGVAPNVNVMPLKFLGSDGSGSFSDAVLAIEYAEAMGADVISASWGGYTIGVDSSMYDAINDFSGLFCAAAGNDGYDMDFYGMFGYHHAPATYPNENIVSVASIDSDGSLSYFSNYGRTSVDLVSPGRSILSTVPGDSYGYKSGTSMATPHVAGTVALMISHDIDLNGSVTRSKVQLKDDLLEATVYKSTYNSVVLDGCLNAYEALLLTTDNGTEPPPPPENEDPYNDTDFPPYMTGTFEVGGAIIAHTGTWIDEGDLDYYCTWQVTADPEEDSPSDYEEWYDESWLYEEFPPIFIVEPGQAEKYIRIEVVAVDEEGLDGVAYSDWEWIEPEAPNEPPVNDGDRPSVTGLMIAGETVYAEDGGWSDDGGVENLEYSYMWQISDTEFGTYEDTGVTADSYSLTEAEVTKFIRVLVTAIDNGDPVEMSEPSESPGRQVIPNAAPVNDITPSITGTLIAGDIAYADIGDWSDDRGEENLSYSYNWKIKELDGSYSDIGGSDNPLSLPESDTGYYIKLEVTATDKGDPVKWTSESSADYLVEPAETPVINTFTSSITDAYPTSIRNKWTATVTVSTNLPMSEAEVAYEWSDGKSVTAGTAPTINGECTVISDPIRKNIGSITFTIIGITPLDNDSDYTFDPAHSDLTVTVNKP